MHISYLLILVVAAFVGLHQMHMVAHALPVPISPTPRLEKSITRRKLKASTPSSGAPQQVEFMPVNIGKPGKCTTLRANNPEKNPAAYPHGLG
ncbi:hypothetical protein FPV67DRAFT_1117754 [Lyophyllum atratum]|nr:hypothetical protein FPV67DRAFT_1117754 [Lyophyllum atratum]